MENKGMNIGGEFQGGAQAHRESGVSQGQAQERPTMKFTEQEVVDILRDAGKARAANTARKFGLR